MSTRPACMSSTRPCSEAAASTGLGLHRRRSGRRSRHAHPAPRSSRAPARAPRPAGPARHGRRRGRASQSGRRPAARNQAGRRLEAPCRAALQRPAPATMPSQIARPGDEAMVRCHPDQRRRRLDRIDAAHLRRSAPGCGARRNRGRSADGQARSQSRSLSIVSSRSHRPCRASAPARPAGRRRASPPARTASRDTGSHRCQRISG